MPSSWKRKGRRILALWMTCLLVLGSWGSFGFANTGETVLNSETPAGIKVQMYNVSREEKTQQPSPQIKLLNDGTSAIQLQDVKLRYYFTAEGEKTMSFDCWTSIGKENLTANFVPMPTPLEGADYYLEIGFTSGAGLLEPGKDVSIASWFNKSDWSSFTQTNDYSFDSTSSDYVDSNRVPAYVAGDRVWGSEPEIPVQPLPDPAVSPIKVLAKTGTSSSTQQPSPGIEIYNTANTAVDLRDVKVRYYFTVDGEKPMSVDFWTTTAKQNVNAQFVKMAVPASQADHYLEIGFTDSAGVLQPGSKVGVYTWFNKSDWSSFNQTNDYSFTNSADSVESNKVTGYVSGALKWGIEPELLDKLPTPSNLNGSAAENVITLTWSPLQEATAYDLEADGTIISDLTSTTYTHTNLAPGSQHHYRVKAKNEHQSSDWSSSLSLYTTPSSALSIPANLQVLPVETSIAVSWNPVAGASSYDLEADGTIISHLVDPSYAHQGLLPDTLHSYRVRAVNASSTSAWSPVVTANTQSRASSSSRIKVSLKTGTNTSTQMVTPEIEISNVSQYPINLEDLKARYYFTIDGEKPLSIDFWTTAAKQNVTATFVKMSIPSAQADHYLEIGFSEGAGVLEPGSMIGVYPWYNKADWSRFDQTNDYSFISSSSSVESSKTTGYISDVLDWGTEPLLLDMPPFPANVTAVPADTYITVSWNPVEGATGYDIEADGNVVENITDTTYVNQWLNPGTRHTYKLRSRKGTAVSVWSSPITLKTTGEQVLPAPVNVRSTKTSDSINLIWDALQESVTGYDIEVDGTIVDAGNKTSYSHSGLTSGSRHTYRVRAKDGSTTGAWSSLLTLNTIFVPTGTFDVNFTIDTTADRALISPYIYGTNDDLTGTENWTSRRMGGNRLTTYNWENNASNAGSDWIHSSDDFVPMWYGGVPWGGNRNEPGIGATGFHEKSLSKGAYSLITLQTSGYVAKDKDGSVSADQQAPSSRWVEVKPSKGAPFSLTPDVNDGFVYEDEFVNFLVNKFGPASTPTGIKGYAIDNEPGLWPDTHPYMHPDLTGSAEVLNKSVGLAKAVKKVDPSAEMFGPVLYGFAAYFNMQNAPDWNAVKGNYAWYIDYYLDHMRIESAKEGKRLLDVLDLHWYPEISAGGVRITSSNTNDNIAANKARMQAPRSLWDPSYTEDSWIGQWYSSFLPLIPRVQQSIQTYNAGTKLAFSEYNYGGEGHVSGGIATADALGIYGKYGVYMANYWKMVNTTEEAPYSSVAFKIYNNYDSQNSKFGDTKVKAETSDIENSSIYGSVFKDSDNRLHMIVMNKNYDYDMNAVFQIAGGTNYRSAQVWAFDSTSPNITERQAVPEIANNSFTYTIPKLTVCHIVLTKDPASVE